MTLLEFRDEIIRRGIASVHEHEKRPERIAGCLYGFELCGTLATPEDFQRVLTERHAEEIRMISAREDPDDYWKYRCATAQVEHVWERMKIAWGLPGPYYASAVMQYVDIVGVKGERHT